MDAATDLSVFVRHPEGGPSAIDLVVEGVYCGACIVTIEKGLAREPGVHGARVNLASRRVTVEFDESRLTPKRLLDRLDSLGYPAYPFAAPAVDGVAAAEERSLLRCLGVAAFGAMNVMLLSVALWSGAATGQSGATRDLFHWLSAIIVLPTAAYAGRPFFDSALRALKQFSFNMDVPITLGVTLALVLSVAQTLQHQTEAYFDSAAMLLLFLLAGRTLDQRMRRKTRDVASNLAAMKAETAVRLLDSGEAVSTPIVAVKPGDLVLVRAGERIAVDGRVESGRSEIDQSLVTGETAAVAAAAGANVYAGTLNLTGVLRVRVAQVGEGTLLDEVNALLERAIEQRSSYVRLADRASRFYAPLVHLTALATFLGWMAWGLGWQNSLVVAITVLIITCPCALGLAVPAVQVVAASAMFRRKVMLNSGDALERLADIDTIVFDKTGTLTLPYPSLANGADIAPEDLAFAGALALASRHPLAKAVAAAARATSPLTAQEFPGEGVEAEAGGESMRLGSLSFCEAETEGATAAAAWPDASLIGFRRGPRAIVFALRQAPRADAREVIASLKRDGLAIEILSGDRVEAVSTVARELGVERFAAALKPADKIARLKALRAEGRRVLMVGDGLNDAPALAVANVSMSPISATHLTQAQADAVFLGDRLAPVADAIRLSRKAKRLMIGNLSLSVVYNFIAVPIAIAGLASPLIAAAAMSGSSVLVTLNALRARTARGVSP